MTYCTASIVQLFLIHLHFNPESIFTVFLGFLVAVHLGFSFATGVMIFTEFFTARHMVFTIAGVGAILCGLTDILIAGCLGTKFFNFKLKYRHGSTPRRVPRITEYHGTDPDFARQRTRRALKVAQAHTEL
ncbi:hypothetical protein B0H19DRAFT_1272133 [Mycena capillaripes]|nr:hypothetical protein B0H19DRAFT_1272133 [Mycena capillaripes]